MRGKRSEKQNLNEGKNKDDVLTPVTFSWKHHFTELDVLLLSGHRPKSIFQVTHIGVAEYE
jgi:hypothetical protein